MKLPGNISKLGDEELLKLYAQTGQAEYFGELYNRYIPLLYGISLKYMRQAETAEDAVMGLFEMLMPKISNYDIKVFRIWIYSVAKNHCLQLLRREKPVVKVDFNDAVMESDDGGHLFEEDNRQTVNNALHDCIEKLPEPQRVSINMFFMEDRSYQDISQMAGYSLASVKSYIQNGKRNLKICLERQSVL